MASASLEQQPSPRRLRLTTPQALWLTAQVAVLAGVVWAQFFQRPDTWDRFWCDALGMRQAVGAAVLLLVNFAALAGGCCALNRSAGAAAGPRALLRGALAGVLYGVCFVALYLPALFVLLIGPAAVNLRATLLSP
jgi:hypothetical protein